MARRIFVEFGQGTLVLLIAELWTFRDSLVASNFTGIMKGLSQASSYDFLQHF